MNQRLTTRELDACLLSLERALVLARVACWEKDIEKAEALIDAFHNMPRLLLGERPGWPTGDWSLAGHNQLFLESLLERYPELRGSGLDLTPSPEADEAG